MTYSTRDTRDGATEVVCNRHGAIGRISATQFWNDRQVELEAERMIREHRTSAYRSEMWRRTPKINVHRLPKARISG